MVSGVLSASKLLPGVVESGLFENYLAMELDWQKLWASSSSWPNCKEH